MFENHDFLPPHETTSVPGFHAYSHCVSVPPGGEVDIRVSGEGPIVREVVRIGAGQIPRTPSEPAAAQLVDELGQFQAEPRTVCRGSYVYVAEPVTLASPFAAELWCRLLAIGTAAGLMSRDGFQLSILDDGRLALDVRDQTDRIRLVGPVLRTKHWQHIVGQYDGHSIQLFLDGRLVADRNLPRQLSVDNSSLRLGALSNARGETTCLLTGDICGPSLYREVLPEQEIARRYENRVTDPGPNCVGHWKFDALEGSPYRDVSGFDSHGKGVNHPLRMIPGPRMSEEQSWAQYDPTADPNFGHAVRLMPDQLVDCRWPETFHWNVPTDLAPGQYAIRLTDASQQVRFVPLIVRPIQPTTRLLCLSTTNTRLAYDYQPFDNPDIDYGAYLDHPAYPVKGHLMGPRRPATGPGYFFSVVNLELPFYQWLDEQGIAYDLYSEWDLEADPSLWEHYSVVAWAGHSEYWTAARFENLQRFRRRGGHILSLSGNTCFWRVSLDMQNGVLEVRKHGDAATAKHGGTVDPMLNNAHWHQIDHLPGTTMQESGWPPFQLGLGLTNGWTRPCRIDGISAGYEVLMPKHSLFHQPHPIDTDVPLAQGGAGYETDISLTSMIERFGPPQRRNRLPQDTSNDLSIHTIAANGPTVLTRAQLPNNRIFDYDLNWADGELWAEMHIWEPPGEGITFAAGSCMAALALQDDENFSNFMLNVLHRMHLTPESHEA